MHQYSSGVFSDSELSPGPLHELATIFLFSSPSVITELCIDQGENVRHGTVT